MANLTKRGRFYLLTAVLSFIFSYLVVTLRYFPFFGTSLSLTIFTIFSYSHKNDKSKNVKLFIILTLIFSILLVIRSEPLITFFNLSAALFFGVLMLTSGSKKLDGFIEHVLSPFTLFFKTLFTKSDYYPERINEEGGEKTNDWELIFGLFVSVIVLLVIIPLLSSTNPIFKGVVENTLGFFNLKYLIDRFGYQTFFVWSLRIVFFLGFLFILPKLITLIEKRSDFSLPTTFKTRVYPLQIPKLIVSAVLIVFFVTQIQFYLATEETLRAMNVSYSQHANEVFGQLTVVAGVVLVLMYNSSRKNKNSRLLNWMLGIEGVFLTLMAYKSAFEYIAAYGLTYKRLYGLTVATLVTGVFILYKRYSQKKDDNFVRNVILFSASILLIVNLANFDWLIYNFDMPRTGQNIDYGYLSTLSPDSLSYKDQFEKLQAASSENFKGNYFNDNPLLILHKIEYLQNKYSDLDFRTFNLLEYIEYQNVKSLDTSDLRSYYEEKLRIRY